MVELDGKVAVITGAVIPADGGMTATLVGRRP